MDTDEIILKGDSAVAADWCLNFLKEEGSIVVVGEEMYICIDLRDVFDSTLNDVDWEMEDDETLKDELNLFPISWACRNEIHGKNNDEVMAILCWFDKFFGYDSAISDGIVGLTFNDLKKNYNFYREKVSDKDVPVFEEGIRKIFKEKTDRFLKLMGYEAKEIPREPHLWETSGPDLKGTCGGDTVDSISEIETKGLKLLYWSWKRNVCGEFEYEFYNGIVLTFIDLDREGKIYEVIVNFEDNVKEKEEILLKDLIKRTAINLLSM